MGLGGADTTLIGMSEYVPRIRRYPGRRGNSTNCRRGRGARHARARGKSGRTIRRWLAGMSPGTLANATGAWGRLTGMGHVSASGLACILVAVLGGASGCASGDHFGGHPGGQTPPRQPTTTVVATSSKRLPPVPSALVTELNRGRASARIRLLDPNAEAPVSELDALAAARWKGPRLGKVTSASLATMGLPGSLNSPTRVWLLGIAYPKGGLASGGSAPVLPQPPKRGARPRFNFGAQVVNATTGKWVESGSGYDPRYRLGYR